MEHHPANNAHHDHSTFSTTCVTLRSAGNPSIALSGHMLLDDKDFWQGSCNARVIGHEWEQQYRQRWKIE